MSTGPFYRSEDHPRCSWINSVWGRDNTSLKGRVSEVFWLRAAITSPSLILSLDEAIVGHETIVRLAIAKCPKLQIPQEAIQIPHSIPSNGQPPERSFEVSGSRARKEVDKGGRNHCGEVEVTLKRWLREKLQLLDESSIATIFSWWWLNLVVMFESSGSWMLNTAVEHHHCFYATLITTCGGQSRSSLA